MTSPGEQRLVVRLIRQRHRIKQAAINARQMAYAQRIAEQVMQRLDPNQVLFTDSPPPKETLQ